MLHDQRHGFGAVSVHPPAGARTDV